MIYVTSVEATTVEQAVEDTTAIRSIDVALWPDWADALAESLKRRGWVLANPVVSFDS